MSFFGLALLSCRLHGATPPGRDEPGCKIGQWREHEQPGVGGGMWHDEKLGRRVRVDCRVEGTRLGRSLDLEPRTAEDKEIEVELARAPVPSSLPPEFAFESFERGEESERRGRVIGAGRPRDIECDDRIPEFRLIDHANGIGRVQP